jgi:hypothetical protein
VGTWLGVELGVADGLALGFSLGCSLGSSVAAKDRSTVLLLRLAESSSVAKSTISSWSLPLLVHQWGGGTRDSVHALVWIKSARALVRVYTARFWSAKSSFSLQWLNKPTSTLSIRTGPPATMLQTSDVVQKAVVSSSKEIVGDKDWFLESLFLRQRLVAVVSFMIRFDCHPKMLTESPTLGRVASCNRVTGSTVVVEASCTSMMSYDEAAEVVVYSGWTTSRVTE